MHTMKAVVVAVSRAIVYTFLIGFCLISMGFIFVTCSTAFAP